MTVTHVPDVNGFYHLSWDDVFDRGTRGGGEGLSIGKIDSRNVEKTRAFGGRIKEGIKPGRTEKKALNGNQTVSAVGVGFICFSPGTFRKK